MIESLMAGEPVYPRAMRAAKSFWDEFHEQHAADDPGALRSALEAAQIPFQWRMEDAGLAPPLAKGMLLLTCVGSLYEDGFRDDALARRVVEAVAGSRSLSIEVVSSAGPVANLYGISG